MGLSVALTTVEHILLDILENGEPGAAGRVCRSVLAIRTSDTLGDRTCSYRQHFHSENAPVGQ